MDVVCINNGAVFCSPVLDHASHYQYMSSGFWKQNRMSSLEADVSWEIYVPV